MEKEIEEGAAQGSHDSGFDDELFKLAYDKKLLGEYTQAAKILEELEHELKKDGDTKHRRRVMLEAARMFLMIGKYTRARSYAEQVLANFAGDEDAEEILGRICTAEYDMPGARAHFSKLADDNGKKYLGLCLVAIKERRLVQAQDTLAQGKPYLEVDDPEYVLLWCYVAFLEGKHKEAIAKVRQVMSDPPRDTHLLLLAAEIFMTSGTYAEARKVTDLVNRYAPAHDHAFAIRAYALYAEEEYAAAEKDAYKSLENNKKNAYALTVLMKCATRKGDYDYAHTLGLRILHDAPGYSLGHANMGDVYFNQGEYEQAGIEYNKSRYLMDSLTKGAQLRKARMAFIEGDVPTAIHILRTLVESHHSYYDDAMCDLALCYEKLGDHEKKNDILERMELRRAMYHRTEQVMEKLA